MMYAVMARFHETHTAHVHQGTEASPRKPSCVTTTGLPGRHARRTLGQFADVADSKAKTGNKFQPVSVRSAWSRQRP